MAGKITHKQKQTQVPIVQLKSSPAPICHLHLCHANIFPLASAFAILIPCVKRVSMHSTCRVTYGYELAIAEARRKPAVPISLVEELKAVRSVPMASLEQEGQGVRVAVGE